MTHVNAPLAPVGRLRLASLIIEEGWSVRRAAERFQVSPATASKWRISTATRTAAAVSGERLEQCRSTTRGNNPC